MHTRPWSILAAAAAGTMLSAGCATRGDFTLSTINGEQMSLRQQDGKVVLLTFFAER